MMSENVNIQIHAGMNNMDFDKVTTMLSTAFWSEGIQKDEVLQGASNSALVVGAFNNDIQVGYARVISDKTRFAYILDVIVDENFRKMGIGQSIIKFILSNEELQDIYQWLLITKDAHEMYRKCGFSEVSRPMDWMEIRNNRMS